MSARVLNLKPLANRAYPGDTLIKHMSRLSRRSLVCRLILALAVTTLLHAQAPTPPLYQNPDLPPEQRAADLVSHMTLEEKAGQMQNTAPAIPRLGIPAYDWWNEALHGVARAGLATVFPQAIGLASTFDAPLLHNIAAIISTEARAKYNDAIAHGNHGRYYGLTFWSPNINIFRDPRWGRGQETYGEDPYLTGRLAIAFITGLQGDDPHYFKVIATAKHYAVHSGPEPSRHEFNVDPSRTDLEQTYLPAFRAAVVEGKADSVMCAYNSVDGIPACANADLLTKQLRQDWGFQGYIVSDCGAIGDISGGHHYKKTLAEASAVAVLAGTDLSCGTEYRTLPEAVQQGLIKESDIDRALIRLFTARFRLGMFDPPERVPFSSIGLDQLDSPAHRQAALDAARESLVLLKNNGVLPFGPNVHNIAVIGPGANDPDAMLGNYNGFPSHIVTPLEGIEAQFGDAVHFAQGSMYTTQSSALVPPSVLTDPEGHTGLYAEYFTTADLSGPAAVHRTEPQVYFLRDMHDPALVQALPAEAFSARWTGNLKVARSGAYQLGFLRLRCGDCKGTDAARLYVGDNLVAEDKVPTRWNPRPTQGTISLEAGRTYPVRLEYSQHGGAGGIELIWTPPADALLDEAAEVTRASDAAVVFVGLNSDLEGEEMHNNIPGFLGGDRTSISLPEPQQKLLTALEATGKPLVVVLMSGSAVELNDAQQHASAILAAWYGGQSGGVAVARALAGLDNPAGRLPVTFYHSLNQLPPFDDYSMKGRTYRYLSSDPLYPFGYGLSYSMFSYSVLKIRRTSRGSIEASAMVTNHSGRAGDEVAQLYVSGPQGPDAPYRELKGFERLHLAPGETRTVTFMIQARELPRGHLRISIGGGQPLPEFPGIAYVEGML